MKAVIVAVFVMIMAFCLVAPAEGPQLSGGNILACETYSFHEMIRAGRLDMVTVPEYYKRLGIPGISFNEIYFKSFDDDYIDRVKAAVKASGRTVVCFVISGNLAMADQDKRHEAIETVRRKIRAAARLGAPVVRINLGSTGPQENADSTVGIERVIAVLKEILPVARELRVRIAIENHGGVSKSAADIVKVILGTDPKWVGALIDFGNFPKDVRYDAVGAMAPYAMATHVKVNDFDTHGEAIDYDFPRVLGILKSVHFHGPLSIEYEGNGDPVEGVQKTKALILKYW
jgi:sugar phosphate isomerase/epimerase